MKAKARRRETTSAAGIIESEEYSHLGACIPLSAKLAENLQGGDVFLHPNFLEYGPCRVAWILDTSEGEGSLFWNVIALNIDSKRLGARIGTSLRRGQMVRLVAWDGREGEYGSAPSPRPHAKAPARRRGGVSSFQKNGSPHSKNSHKEASFAQVESWIGELRGFRNCAVEPRFPQRPDYFSGIRRYSEK